ncbi:MAG TPA: hypothetical protein VI732_02895 [Alphaproteobacteria bacterium]|nr:hypothetical protein [Alphaproteobacteria bacterium]
MKKYFAVAFLLVVVLAIYGLDHGIFVGTTLYRAGPPPCCPEEGDLITKKCRYLFVTGISEIVAHDGQTYSNHPPYNGYCPLFAE